MSETTPANPQPKKRGRPRKTYLTAHNEDCTCEVCRARIRAKTSQLIRDGAEVTLPSFTEIEPGKRKNKQFRVRKNPADPTKITLVPSGQIVKSYVADWAIMKMSGKSNSDIAKELGISPSYLSSCLTVAHNNGWLKFNELKDRLEFVIAPKVVDNIEHFIDNKSERMTIEAAKGLGMFQSHQAVKVDGGEQQTALILNIEMAPATEVKQVTGTIMGRPKYLEGETVDAI